MRLTSSSERTMRLLFVSRLVSHVRFIYRLNAAHPTNQLHETIALLVEARSKVDSMTSKFNNSAESRKCKDFSTSTNPLRPLGIRPCAYVIYKISCVLACAPCATKFVLNCGEVLVLLMWNSSLYIYSKLYGSGLRSPHSISICHMFDSAYLGKWRGHRTIKKNLIKGKPKEIKWKKSTRDSRRSHFYEK